jgi:hypothetical protein
MRWRTSGISTSVPNRAISEIDLRRLDRHPDATIE